MGVAKESGLVEGSLGGLMKQGFPRCGRVVLDVGGGVKVLQVPEVKETDMVLITLESDDSGMNGGGMGGNGGGNGGAGGAGSGGGGA